MTQHSLVTCYTGHQQAALSKELSSAKCPNVKVERTGFRVFRL